MGGVESPTPPRDRAVHRRDLRVGVSVAAVALTAGAVRGIMAATFYPLMFFSGLYFPYNSSVTYGTWCSAGSPTPRPGWSSRCELLASSLAERGDRASPTSGSGIRTVDLLLARGEP